MHRQFCPLIALLHKRAKCCKSFDKIAFNSYIHVPVNIGFDKSYHTAREQESQLLILECANPFHFEILEMGVLIRMLVTKYTSIRGVQK